MTSDLVNRLSKLDAPCNRTDVLIELAFFKPDENYKSARANEAGTKVIFTRTNGKRETCRAYDYTLTPERRAKSIALLRAKEASL
ncbi:hypothetical protein [Brucella haematophila]|uniref:Uncharacterized protein n=1 Tax=Brucella haematophila TaxID=419474 RepID=A0ABX1DND9_9HYPH|nr:hypothetical protein [Brucella haematophila]NKC04467.1 hypothetical protein [Brucella haematophila]TMV03831.1 hypothetical protein FGI60_07575 [Brucella haematophila]